MLELLREQVENGALACRLLPPRQEAGPWVAKRAVVHAYRSQDEDLSCHPYAFRAAHTAVDQLTDRFDVGNERTRWVASRAAFMFRFATLSLVNVACDAAVPSQEPQALVVSAFASC